MSTMPLYINWEAQGPSFRFDVLCLIIALLIHAPLYFVKLDMRKKATVDRPKQRLVSVDLVDVERPKPKFDVPKAPPKKETGLFAKLKALVKKEPPPPPKVVKKAEPKLLDVPKEIKLQSKLKTPALAKNKLKSKAGFKTAADPTLVKEAKISLKALNPGVAPLSAKKVGVVKDRGAIKKSRGNFKMAKTDVLTGIGGGSGAPSLGDAAAPSIAIRTSRKGTVEKLSAASKADKGKFKGGTSAGLNPKKLSLRDRIIARDAAPAKIGGTGASPTRAVGLPSTVAAKRNAGTFDPKKVAGTLAAPANKVKESVPKIAPTPKRKKKSMFVITGPLKDRKVLKKAVPQYPAWAQAKGIEATVVLQFTVSSDGFVKNTIVVRRTSGYPQLDQSAIAALEKWRFVALPDGGNREEVGLITFNYSLS